jgi:hypothetical protein
MARGELHYNRLTVTGTATGTGRAVTGTDPLQVEALLAAMRVVKEAFWAADLDPYLGAGVLPIPPGGTHIGRTPADLRWRITITNTGDVPLSNVTAADYAPGIGPMPLERCATRYAQGCIPTTPPTPITLPPGEAAWYWTTAAP